MADKKPPYTAASDIDTFLEKAGHIKPPKVAGTAWAKSFLGIKQGEGIPVLLQWLGISNDKNKPDEAKWNAVRLPTTRAKTLEEMVRQAYSAIFDQVELEKVTRPELDAAFVQAYQLGNTQRYVGCFLALCARAGISVPAFGPKSTSTTGAPVPEKRRGQPAERKTTSRRRVSRGDATISVVLSVQIPPEWDEAAIRRRVAAVSEALRNNE